MEFGGGGKLIHPILSAHLSVGWSGSEWQGSLGSACELLGRSIQSFYPIPCDDARLFTVRITLHVQGRGQCLGDTVSKGLCQEFRLSIGTERERERVCLPQEFPN